MLQVFALCGFAIAQPLFDLLGRNATFLVAHVLQGTDLVLFALGLIVVPPAVLLAVLVVARLVSVAVGRWTFSVIAGTLVALFAVPAVDRAVGLANWLWIVAMLGVAATATALFARTASVRRFVCYLSPAPLLFLALFLFASPASDLLSTTDPAALAGPSTATTPVVVLVFDEFPLGAIVDGSGQLDDARFPGFARLARASTWYPNATTVSAESHLAVPAILSGRVPTPGTAPVAAAYPRTLFTMLGRGGPVRAIEDVTHLCPDSICTGRSSSGRDSLVSDLGIVFGYTVLPGGLEQEWLPSLDGQWSNFGGEPATTVSRASLPSARSYLEGLKRTRAKVGRDDPATLLDRYIGSITGPARPALWFGHFHFPHRTYKRLPTGELYLDPEGHPGLNDRWPLTRQLAGFQATRLLLQVGDADRFVGRMLDRLRDEGMLDRTMVVVAADHGQSLRDPTDVRGLKTMDAVDRDDVLPVPLFVKYPGRRGGVVDRRVAETIDILPTIADELDAQLPDDWRFDGRSLLAPPRADRSRTSTFFGGAPQSFLRAVDAARSGRWLREQIAAPQDDQRDFYRLAPYGALVGRPVADLAPRAALPRAIARVAIPDSYRRVRRASGWLPSLLRARLSGVDGEHVAVALNGTIAGVGPMFDDRARFQAAAMLDPTFFREGANAVTLYRVSGPPEAPVLEPITTKL